MGTSAVGGSSVWLGCGFPWLHPDAKWRSKHNERYEQ